jgi:hypothetical protein
MPYRTAWSYVTESTYYEFCVFYNNDCLFGDTIYIIRPKVRGFTTIWRIASLLQAANR